MDKTIKELGRSLAHKFEELKRENADFIIKAISHKEKLMSFTQFNKDNGEINEDAVVDEVIETAPIATAFNFNGQEDFYIIGAKRVNTNKPNDPYYIVIYGIPYDTPDYVKEYNLEDISTETYHNIVDFITDAI